jgi:hypothetical protein
MLSKSNRTYATVIGAGLALSPIHNKWLTDITSIDGMATLFVPAFGYGIWIVATGVFLRDNWQGIGDRKYYIPLFIIVGAIGLSGITADTPGKMIAPFLMGISMFALYLAGRGLGKDIFLPLAIGAGIASLGVIVLSIVNPGYLTGGLLFENNYDIVVGYVLLGAALYIHRYQWILASLALVAMLLSGSPEGLFALGVLALVVIWQRDWGKKLAIAMIPLIIGAVALFSLGYGQQLYSYALKVANGEAVVTHIEETPEENKYPGAIGYRVWVIKEAMTNIQPLGEGYVVTAFRQKIVHNVPLIIVQQLGYPGILAGIAWLFVSIYCLIRTKYKYAWALMLGLGVFDHFTWTQIGYLWWAVVGMSTNQVIIDDRIFKGHYE